MTTITTTTTTTTTTITTAATITTAKTWDRVNFYSNGPTRISLKITWATSKKKKKKKRALGLVTLHLREEARFKDNPAKRNGIQVVRLLEMRGKGNGSVDGGSSLVVERL
ncbi:hypothetical protein M0802_005580 [Mischocyttarus mexicanus]|nr:hypothetical protein M0802_005580 [Mischocyttarus mexicanus]